MDGAVAFSIGTLTVYWYGIIIVGALIVGLLITFYIAAKKQVATKHIYNLFFYLVPAGLIGGRIGYVITDWNFFIAHPQAIIKVWEGGITIFGVLLAGLLTVWIYSRVKKVSFWGFSDAIIVAVPLMQAIGRWGNYMNQELFGPPTSLPWGIYIGASHRPVGHINQQYFHPLFLYESILLLFVFIALWYAVQKMELKKGRLTLLYFSMFFMVRFLLDFLRIDPPQLGFLSWAQWLCLVGGACVILLWRRLSVVSGERRIER